jgi:hypothetical protein
MWQAEEAHLMPYSACQLLFGESSSQAFIKVTTQSHSIKSKYRVSELSFWSYSQSQRTQHQHTTRPFRRGRTIRRSSSPADRNPSFAVLRSKSQAETNPDEQQEHFHSMPSPMCPRALQVKSLSSMHLLILIAFYDASIISDPSSIEDPDPTKSKSRRRKQKGI